MRRIKKKQKELTRKRTALLVLYVIIFVLLIGVGWRIYGSLKKSLWDGVSEFNLVFRSEPVLVISLDPAEASINALMIPDGTFIEATHGYGPYRVEVIYRLGELESRGEELLADSLQEYLGVPIDGWLGEIKGEFKEEREVKPLVTRSLWAKIKDKKTTNLTRWDLFRLWWEMLRIKGNKVSLVDLAETSASTPVTLPDSSQATKVEPERLDRIASRLFADEKVQVEDLSLAVLNGTDKSGLASQGARIIANIGGRVVRVGEAEGLTGRENCQIRSEEKYKKTYTLKRVKQIFNCQWLEGKLEDQRTEVVVILGEDYWQKLYLPFPTPQ